MIKKFIFNRRKKNTIILIHGLFTSSGFWLSYLSFFKNFRIITYDINYDALLKEDNDKVYICKKLNLLKEDINVVAVISHSFGTVISDIVFEKEENKIFKICPVAFSKRLKTSDFKTEIINKSDISLDDINFSMHLVENFNSRYRDVLNYSGSIFIPDNDIYFSYKIPHKNKINFNGNHFNISSALDKIVSQLPID